METIETKERKRNKQTIQTRFSIKIRLLLIPIIIVLISIIGIGVISSYNARESLLNEMSNNGHFFLGEFIDRLDNNAQAMDVVNNTIEEDIRIAFNLTTNLGDELNNDSLTRLAEGLMVDQINYYNPEGVIIYTNIPEYMGWEADENHSLYTFFNSGEEEIMEEIRADTVSNVYYKFGVTKLPNGDFIQVGINADHIHSLTEQFSYQTLIDDLATTEGIMYALFTNTNFQVTAHSMEEPIETDLSEDPGTVAAITNGVPYSSEYLLEDEIPVLDIVYPAVINDELVGAVNIGFSMEGINSAIQRNILIVAISGIVAILLIGIILFTSSNYAIKIVNKLKEQMGFMAKGDFSRDIPEDILKKNDEFGEISQSVYAMQNAMRNVIKNVLDKSQMVAAHSEELTATTEESSSVANEISEVIENIATGASEQSKNTEDGYESITELGKSVEENVDNLQYLNNSIEKVDTLKNEGSELMDKVVENNNMGEKAAIRINEVVNNTNKSAEEIAVASEMISSIAEQTNLLALNASIEAARAGEFGKGFAVVAEEIRKLADQSNQFTEEIGAIIKSLTDTTLMAVQSMDDLEHVVKSQDDSINMTRNKFDGISESIEAMKNVVNMVNESSNEMAIKKDNIVAIIEHLSTISEENAAGSEEASASVEEQTAAMLEISNSSQELANIAEELNSQVEQFKI